jgi:hypothetical protein
MNTKDIAVDLHETDGFTLSAIVNGYLVQHRYIGENIKSAKRHFIALCKEGK